MSMFRDLQMLPNVEERYNCLSVDNRTALERFFNELVRNPDLITEYREMYVKSGPALVRLRKIQILHMSYLIALEPNKPAILVDFDVNSKVQDEA